MGLLDGQLAASFASVFSSFYLDATLYRSTITANGAGGGTQAFDAGTAVKAQLTRTTQAMRERDNYVDTDQRILVLADGVAPIDTDAEIVVKGQRWSIAYVAQDPVGAYYDLHGRKA